MIQKLFENFNYKEYCFQNKIHMIPGIDINLEEYGDIEKKTINKWETIDPSNTIPFPVELDDLVRLHYLIRKRKVRTILEFGIGKSSYVMLDALLKNKDDYSDRVNSELRISTPFQLHSVDNNASWLGNVQQKLTKNELFFPYLCPLSMGTFNGRICTFYDNLPNVRPDFIYLDGPDQFSAGGSVRGLNCNHPDRMPMAADILALEHFLEPGTLIVVDGRTANARFLKANFQRNWDYEYIEEFDQHFFVMNEPPLGKWNKAALEFTMS